MAWVQVGIHKINTALICYAEQEGDTVRLYFHGEWEGNPLDLHFDEAKAFWRHLKAEDVMMNRDKGSATVLPRVKTAAMLDVHAEGAAKSKPATPAAGSHSSSHSSGSHSSGSHSSSSHSSSHSAKPHDSHRHSEHKRH